MPVFSHAADDVASFRLFTSQLIVNGAASQAQVARVFGVPLVTVKLMCKKMRELGRRESLLHGQANAAQDRVIEKLCEELNATETVYPGTDWVLKYPTLRSSPFPRDQIF